MNAIYVTICALVILLGFEIRYRLMGEELASLKAESGRLDKEVLKLQEEMKLKKNAYEEFKPPAQK